MQINIFTTGGTIDKIYFDRKSTYQVGDPQADDVLQRANVAIDYRVESIMKKDSLEMTDADRALIRQKVADCEAKKIIITHGTDTMATTGRELQGLPGKTIVMTGSMYPARFSDSDAVFNLGGAVIAAQTLPPGVYLVINGRVFTPDRARKNVARNRFEEI